MTTDLDGLLYERLTADDVPADLVEPSWAADFVDEDSREITAPVSQAAPISEATPTETIAVDRSNQTTSELALGEEEIEPEEAPPADAESRPDERRFEPTPADGSPLPEPSAPIVPVRPPGERFVLQFSTGESFTVFGSGLVGRSPNPEPGEFFDQLVSVLDWTRSVSKTHLEFGQEEGQFWVKDRFSGNGTILREPDAAPRRCQPDKRYRLARGTRIELGEQFFIVS